MFPEPLDVLVAGGGPAGSTAASLVARRGYRVGLLERERRPRFKVGESLVPHTWDTFDRLGLVGRLKRSHFQKKHSVQFFSSSGRGSAPFYFSETDPHERSTTWQVRRSEFDALLLEGAEENGVRVQRGVQVQDVLFDGDRAVGVRARARSGAAVEIPARVVVDATGRRALIARRLGLLVSEPYLRKVSIFSHFRGARRDDGKDEGATLILRTRRGDAWFWVIPLAGDVVSVGVVGELDRLTGPGGDVQTRFEMAIRDCPPLEERLAGAEQVMPVRVAQDFSYCAERIAGPGWVLVGDAFAFLDPIYSTGVLLALRSGEGAADSICHGLAAGDLSGEALGAFAGDFIAGMRAFRKMVYAFYDRDFNFADFLKANPECRQGVIDILSGNVFGSGVESIFGPMEQMARLPADRSVGAV